MNALELASPIRAGVLEGDVRRFGRFQCREPLSSEDCRRLDACFAREPGMVLRVYPSGSGGSIDFGFLEQLPHLRNLWIEEESGRLNDLSALATLPI